MFTISSPAQCLLLLLDGAPRGGEDEVLLLVGVLGSLVSLLLLHGRLQPRLADLLGRVRSADPPQPRLRSPVAPRTAVGAMILSYLGHILHLTKMTNTMSSIAQYPAFQYPWPSTLALPSVQYPLTSASCPIFIAIQN